MSNPPPYPVIYCPTRADRAAALARMRTAGIHIAGRPESYPLGEGWEVYWGATHHYIGYCPYHRGVLMLTSPFPLSDHDLTLVNSADHFVSYVRRHKLPLKS